MTDRQVIIRINKRLKAAQVELDRLDVFIRNNPIGSDIQKGQRLAYASIITELNDLKHFIETGKELADEPTE